MSEDQPNPGASTITMTPDELDAKISSAVADAVSKTTENTNAQFEKVMLAIQARPVSRPAADVDAGVLPRTRGTIVTSTSARAAQAAQTAFAAFNYRDFLGAAKPYAKALDLNCTRFGYSQLDAFIQICQESAWNPLAVSSAGAIGLCQIMPDTAKDWGVDPRDPDASIRALVTNMATYRNAFNDALRMGKYGGASDPVQLSFTALDLALASYDAGEGAVESAGGIPDIPETKSYVAIIGGTVRAILGNSATRAQWIQDWNALTR